MATLSNRQIEALEELRLLNARREQSPRSFFYLHAPCAIDGLVNRGLARYGESGGDLVMEITQAGVRALTTLQVPLSGSSLGIRV